MHSVRLTQDQVNEFLEMRNLSENDMDVFYRRELQGGLACFPDHHPGWSGTQAKGDAVRRQVFLGGGIGLKETVAHVFSKFY